MTGEGEAELTAGGVILGQLQLLLIGESLPKRGCLAVTIITRNPTVKLIYCNQRKAGQV